MNINDVANAFVNGRAGKASALTTAAIEQGLVAISYSTPVAWRKADGTVEVTTKKYSQNTSRHVNAIREAAKNNGYNVVEVAR